MTDVTIGNLVAYAGQIAVVTLTAAALPWALRVHSPDVRYGYWRAILGLCLLLPWLPRPAMPVGAGEAAATIEVPLSGVVTFEHPAATWGPDVVVALVLSIGVLARLVWLGAGYLRLRRLKSSGVAAAASEYQDLEQAIGARAEIRYIPNLQQPVMFGLIRPVIFLPIGLRAQAAEIRDAVVAHELWHARRRDWAWVVGEELLRAGFWFHPAIWWLTSCIRHAREEVVDQLTVTLTGRRRDYARALLLFADGTTVRPAPAFAWRRHLFRRIVQLSREDVMSSRQVIASCMLLGLFAAAGGWAAVSAFPMSQSEALEPLQSGPGPIEQSARPVGPDNPLPRKIQDEPAVYPDSPGAREMSVRVTIRITVDGSGAVAESRLTGLELATKDLNVAIRPRSGDAVEQLNVFFEKAAFRMADGGRVEASTLRPTVHEFVQSALQAVRQWRFEPPAGGPTVFDTTIHFSDSAPQTSRNAVREDSPLAGGGAIRVGGNIKPPAKIQDVRPIYPADARDAGVQGVVVMEIRIEGDGQVSQARVVRSVPMLDEAALQAVQQWRFVPTLLNGAPVPVVMTVTVQFTLTPGARLGS